jgi:hypothetical protein
MHPMVQRIERWLLDKPIPFARNPRTHSDAQIAQISSGKSPATRKGLHGESEI